MPTVIPAGITNYKVQKEICSPRKKLIALESRNYNVAMTLESRMILCGGQQPTRHQATTNQLACDHGTSQPASDQGTAAAGVRPGNGCSWCAAREREQDWLARARGTGIGQLATTDWNWPASDQGTELASSGSGKELGGARPGNRARISEGLDGPVGQNRPCVGWLAG